MTDPPWVITVEGPPPPRPGKAHWAAIQRSKKQWTEFLYFKAKQLRIPPQVEGERRHVAVTFYRPGPESDSDNAHSLCKVCLDSAVNAGLLADDSPKHIDLSVTTVSSGKSRTVIEITRLPAGQ